MQKSNQSSPPQERSLAQTIVALLRAYLGGRRGLIVLSVLSLGAAIAFGWGWLVAVGVAPLLITFAPCAAMCAAGLCMRKMGQSPSSVPTDSGTHPHAATSHTNESTAADVSDQAPVITDKPMNPISTQERN